MASKLTRIYPEVVGIYARKPAGHKNCTAACKRNGHLFLHKFKTKNLPIYGTPDGQTLIIGRPPRGKR